MKKLQFLSIFLISIILISCSSEGDSGGVDDVDSFVYTYDGETISITNWEAGRSENTFVVIGAADNGQSFGIEFNKFGDLASANSYSSTDFDFPLSISHKYFNSNYFTVDILGVDEGNKRVEISFSGDLYEDEYDITSTRHVVQGRFNVSYVDGMPAIEGLGMTANVDGDDWHSTNGDQSGGFFFGSDIEINRYSSDAYAISVVMNDENTETGEYAFGVNSTVNKIRFQKYDIATNEFIDYETVGTFNLVEKNVGIQITQVKGTFDLTAVNGGESIAINSGVFNLLYQNY